MGEHHTHFVSLENIQYTAVHQEKLQQVDNEISCTNCDCEEEELCTSGSVDSAAWLAASTC